MATDFSYVNRNKKRVSGSAAFLHFVFTEKGGVDAYNDFVGEQYIKAFISEQSKQINERIQRQVKKDRFKVA